MELKKLVNSYLFHAISTKYNFEANYLGGHSVSVSTENTGQCYTRINRSWYTDAIYYHIGIGDQFYSNIRNTKNSFMIPLMQQSLIYTDLKAIYDGVFYHELGHIVYTPMKECFTYRTRMCEQNAQGFSKLFGKVSNIIEDIVVEGEVMLNRPSSVQYIQHLRNVAFKEAPDVDDKDSLSNLLAVLTYNFRTETGIKLTYINADVYKFAKTYMYIITNTTDPLLRLNREVAFSAGLWDIYNNKEKPSYANHKEGLDYSWVDNIPVQYRDKPTDEQAGEDDSAMSELSDISNIPGIDHSGSTNPSPTSGGNEVPEDGSAMDPQSSSAPGTNNKRNSGFTTTKAADVDAELGACPEPSEKDVFSQADSIIADLNRHIFCNMNTDNQLYASTYNDVVKKYGVTINKITDMIKKRKAWNNTHWEEGKLTGKLNDKAFVKRTHKIYRSRSLPKQEADLAFSLLVDNSGSMHGNKSTICGEAMIVMAEVCNKLNIPYEVNAFTENQSAITIGLKGFKEKFSTKHKGNLALIQRNVTVKGYSMYSGNIDECSLNYVWRHFRTQKPKDKIIIIMSDGETCGSEKVLRKLAKQIEADNITVLGLGIKSHNVTSLYANSKTFDSIEDLQALPKFINDYITSKIFK